MNKKDRAEAARKIIANVKAEMQQPRLTESVRAAQGIDRRWTTAVKRRGREKE